MSRELVILNFNHDTGEVTEISSFTLLVEVLEKVREDIRQQSIITGLDQDKMAMLSLMIEDAIKERDGTADS